MIAQVGKAEAWPVSASMASSVVIGLVGHVTAILAEYEQISGDFSVWIHANLA